MKSHLKFSKGYSIYPALRLGGIDILGWKCNNKHIRKIFQTKRKITPRGKFYWGSFVTNIIGERPGFCQVNFVYLTKLKRRIIKSFIKCIPSICLFLNILILMSLARFVVLLRKRLPICFLIVVLPTNYGLT